MISTSSGFKYTRIYILLKISYQEIYRIVKPINVIDKNLFNTESKIDDQDVKIAFLVFISLVVSVFILPPNKTELENRLKTRGQDSDIVVRNRMDEASSEITHWAEYDYLIINDDLDESVSKVLNILKAERMKRIRQIGLAEFTRSIIDDV